MNPQDAHQIANRQISCLLDLEKTKVLRTEARMILKGILIAQEKEIEFIGQMIEFWEVDDSDLWLPVLGHMKKRLEALKLSCQDLRRVLK